MMPGENSAHFQLLAENIRDVFWIRSPDLQKVYYVSPGFERIWGRPVSALLANPDTWIDFVLPEDRAPVLAAFKGFLAEDGSLDLEYRITRPDGDIRWVRVRGFKARDNEGVVTRLVGVVSDITEQRQVESSLRESEKQMRLRTSALDVAANGVVITDAQGNIEWVNQAFSRLTGYTFAEAVGRNPRMLKSGQHSTALYRQMWDTISRGEVWQGEMINRRKNGELYHEEMTITPVRDAAGMVAHFIAIKLDITERKRSEASIQDLHKKLIVTSRRAGMADVAIDVLHNVGNVLNSVTVSADLLSNTVRQSKQAAVAKLAGLLDQHASDLAEFLTSDPAGRKIPDFVRSLAEALAVEQAGMSAELDNLRKNVAHIAEFIARQHSLARAAEPAEKFAVTEMVDGALRMTEDANERHDIILMRDYQARPFLTTDRHKAAQIVVNLVANAWRACEQSGRTDKQIVGRVTRHGDRVRIAIIDNGIGLAKDDIPRIFGQTFPPRANGAGLHRDATAAAELGGALSAESEGPGRGATFVLELPCPADAPEEEDPTAATHLP